MGIELAGGLIFEPCSQPRYLDTEVSIFEAQNTIGDTLQVQIFKVLQLLHIDSTTLKA
jgi:hypothetical protein